MICSGISINNNMPGTFILRAGELALFLIMAGRLPKILSFQLILVRFK